MFVFLSFRRKILSRLNSEHAYYLNNNGLCKYRCCCCLKPAHLYISVAFPDKNKFFLVLISNISACSMFLSDYKHFTYLLKKTTLEKKSKDIKLLLVI